MAPNSVSFGFSATAMHWLSTSPALESHTHVLASNDADALQRFTPSDEGRTYILELRGREPWVADCQP